MALNLEPNIPWPKNPRLPFVGSWQKTITRIDNMWAQPCAINPVFAVAGAFVFAPMLVSALASYDCIDQAFDRAGRPHRRRRKLSGNISDFLPALPTPKGYVGQALFRGAQLAQKFGYWMTVVDVALDSIVVGTSFAYRWSGCADPDAPTATLTMDHYVPALLPPATFTVTTWLVEQCHAAFCDPATIIIPPGYDAGVTMSLTQNLNTFPPLQDCAWEARVVDTYGLHSTGPLEPFDTGAGTNAVYYAEQKWPTSRRGNRFQVQITKSYGVLNLSGHFTASGSHGTKLSVPKCGFPGFDLVP